MDRVQVVTAKAQDFSFDKTYDAAFSNLVLHNIPHDEKGDVLVAIRDSLENGAPFIWGDLIRYDRLQQELLVGYMHARAFLKGAHTDLVLESWKKERHEDAKLTIDETLDLCRKVGFQQPRLIWEKPQATAAVFYMAKS